MPDAAPASAAAVAAVAPSERRGAWWQGPWLPLAAALAFAFWPLVASPYGMDLALRIAVHAVFALSLHLLVGTTGLVSLGHAAFLGIGAYVTVLASGDSGRSPLVLLPLAVGCSALYALFVGALSLRTRGIYFIMVTLAFAQMAYFVFHDTKVGGGSDGIFLYVKPVFEAGGRVWLDLGEKNVFFYVVLVALVLTYALLAVIERSRFGHALAGIRVSEQRMRAVGFPTYAYKLAAFVIGGALAGLAGFLLAVKDGAVNPELLSWHESGAVLIMLIFGGLGSLRGAVLGAVCFTLLRELFQSHPVMGGLADHWQLTFGLTIIAFVALLPQGLIGLFRRSLRKRAPDASATPPVAGAPAP